VDHPSLPGSYPLTHNHTAAAIPMITDSMAAAQPIQNSLSRFIMGSGEEYAIGSAGIYYPGIGLGGRGFGLPFVVPSASVAPQSY
jgi:hypothetical protein